MASASHSLPAPTMVWTAPDADKRFDKFQETCELWFNGPLADLSDERKINYLLLWAGDEARALVKTWKLSEEAKKSLQSYWDGFQKFVKPRSNYRIARYNLRSCRQGANETIDQFVRRIQTLVQECSYGAEHEETHTVDALIFGVNSPKVQSRLLQEDQAITLDKALTIARTIEITRDHMTALQNSQQVDSSIHTVRSSTKQRGHGATHHRQKNAPTAAHKNARKSQPTMNTCQRCGSQRCDSRNCPAIQSDCRKCGKHGHWEKVCRSRDARKQRPQKHHSRTHVREMHAEEQDSDNENIYFETLHINTLHSDDDDKQAIVMLDLSYNHSRKPLRCKLDTGADTNILPVAHFKGFLGNGKSQENFVSKLKPSKVRIVAYGGSTVRHYGTCEVKINHRGRTEYTTAHVTDTTGPVIIGLPTCRRLGLVTLHYSLSESPVDASSGHKITSRSQLLRDYNDVFTGIGCLDEECHIETDPSVTPIIHPPRRVPYALRDSLKSELDSLVDKGIIRPVTQPTDWVNSYVCVTKRDGRIRLCIDPKHLNKAIKRPHYPTPVFEDVASRLQGAKWFTKLDARSGYWNIKLDNESALLTTFSTPFGRYCYNRLPIRLKLSSDIFQIKMDKIFGSITNVFGIADDIIVAGWSDDGSDHDDALTRVLECARKNNVKFNDDKLVFRQKQLPFFGHIIGEDGVSPDPEKVAAINAMKQPSDVKGLQSFLGMVNYLHRYSPRLSELTAPLRDLCKQSSEFVWNDEHTRAFNAVKKEICSTQNMPYYDPKKPLTLQVDASGRGRGCALIQENGPVAYASKSLTGAETRYSNIERELLGIVYSLERFHEYVYGRHVTIETDHKPLVSIAQKDVNNMPPRLARMMLRIQRYDFTLVYVTGKNVPIADALSRVSPIDGDVIDGLDITVHEMHSYVNASPTALSQVRDATSADATMALLRETIANGWPETRSECPETLAPYWTFRDELGVEDGVVLKGTRIVIPTTLRNSVLEKIHYAHQGMEKCKLRAKSSVYWPNMNKDIENTVSKCATCQQHQPAQIKEPLVNHDVPPHAWHTLSTDLFYWEQSTYLLVVDNYSKFPVVKKMTTTTSKAVIKLMKSIFDEHGLPVKVISDNGPQYSSDEFLRFARDYNFTHVTSSPHHPQSNGLVERNVRTIKSLFTKCRETGADPHLAMICLRSTPIDHNTPSPCELLNGRVYRSLLPAKQKIHSHHNDNLQKRQDAANKSWRGSRQLQPLHADQDVRVRHPTSKIWVPGRVINNASTPRSYIVQTGEGVYRRNRKHLRTTAESFGDLNGDTHDITPHSATASTPSDDQSSRDSECVSPAAAPVSEDAPTLRRSQRTTRPPVRMNL